MLTGRDCDVGQLEELLAGQLEAGSLGIGAFRDGSDAADPLAWAVQARKLLGDRVRIYGFWCFENPAATVMGELRERHDFAVIDRKWILDLWVRRFYSGEGSGWVDLDDEEGYAAAQALYGDPETWERDLDMEYRADHQIGPGHTPMPTGLSGSEGMDAEFSA
ncbi:hypothetical protein AB9K35_07915 [Leisingera sp. XS_AS12]|uniref:hypothetical protein n=2 Tax=Leisingera TaxID=191028 RepID=UPI00041F1863|nr:hypothetical protein [Leisingera caerulea]